MLLTITGKGKKDMLKGVQKNMIMIRLPKSTHFEAAYFLMRSSQREATRGEMTREANRIISESQLLTRKRSAPSVFRRDRISYFAYGALSGAASVAAIWLGFLIWG